MVYEGRIEAVFEGEGVDELFLDVGKELGDVVSLQLFCLVFWDVDEVVSAEVDRWAALEAKEHSARDGDHDGPVHGVVLEEELNLLAWAVEGVEVHISDVFSVWELFS